jgi:methionine synthase I (cobalamin-dependent)
VSDRSHLLARLLDPQQVVVIDGAMGTQLYAKGVFINQCYDELNLRTPDLVREVHRSYVDAGADVIETNTFGASRTKLAPYGLETQTHEINRSAAALARKEAGDNVLVAGAVGPLGVRLEPFGPTSLSEAREIFAEQMRGLKEGGADFFLIETFADISEMEQAILAAREVDSKMPVMAQMTIGTDCLTPYGASAEDIAKSLDAFGANIIGLNCSVGPQIILDAIEKMAKITRKKLVAQPNAGMPREVGGRSMYMASPEVRELSADAAARHPSTLPPWSRASGLSRPGRRAYRSARARHTQPRSRRMRSRWTQRRSRIARSGPERLLAASLSRRWKSFHRVESIRRS